MSIRPTTIDRTGERPCLPDFYFVAKRLAQGRAPSLSQRIVRVLASLRKRIAR